MGISIHIGGTDSNLIIRNKIGTDISGTLPLPNSIDGVRIGEGPSYNMIGKPGKGNIIAFNGGNGITVMTAAELYNTFSCNSIFSNGGLGIDLYPPGPNPNDSGDIDTGPNDGMNYPIIDSIHYISGAAVVFGHLDTQLPSSARVEIFLASPDITGYGEGKIFLGNTFPLVDGSWCDTVTGVTPFDYITTTATDDQGNTSEFSFDYPTPPVVVFEFDKDPVRITIAPNPFDNFTQIVVSGAKAENSLIRTEIYNAAGMLVQSVITNDGVIKINGGDMCPGIYFCRLLLDGREWTVLIVKK
jgi:hypothetical protein